MRGLLAKAADCRCRGPSRGIKIVPTILQATQIRSTTTYCRPSQRSGTIPSRYGMSNQVACPYEQDLRTGRCGSIKAGSRPIDDVVKDVIEESKAHPCADNNL